MIPEPKPAAAIRVATGEAPAQAEAAAATSTATNPYHLPKNARTTFITKEPKITFLQNNKILADSE
jgi:hypothetical protein